MSDDLLDRIAAAKDLAELEAVRVSVLGKQGEITAKLKSLGSMDAETRSRRRRRRSMPCASRSRARSPSAKRRSRPPSSNASSRPNVSTSRFPRPRTSPAPSIRSAR